MNLREFAQLMFGQCELLTPYRAHVEEIYKRFTAYKHHIPVNGAILLNRRMDRCLMVRGWKSGSSWGFPRGKVRRASCAALLAARAPLQLLPRLALSAPRAQMNKEEEEAVCACREVEEEIGYDISNFLVETDKVSYSQSGQRISLYIIAGFDEQTPFAPQTRKEVGAIAWHPVKDLPTAQTAGGVAGKGVNNSKHKYFMVHPFVGAVRQWIAARKALERQGVPLPLIPLHGTTPAPGGAPAPREAAAEVPLAMLQPQTSSAWLGFSFDRGAVLQALG